MNEWKRLFVIVIYVVNLGLAQQTAFFILILFHFFRGDKNIF